LDEFSKALNITNSKRWLLGSHMAVSKTERSRARICHLASTH